MENNDTLTERLQANTAKLMFYAESNKVKQPIFKVISEIIFDITTLTTNFTELEKKISAMETRMKVCETYLSDFSEQNKKKSPQNLTNSQEFDYSGFEGEIVTPSKSESASILTENPLFDAPNQTCIDFVTQRDIPDETIEDSNEDLTDIIKNPLFISSLLRATKCQNFEVLFNSSTDGFANQILSEKVSGHKNVLFAILQSDETVFGSFNSVRVPPSKPGKGQIVKKDQAHFLFKFAGTCGDSKRFMQWRLNDPNDSSLVILPQTDGKVPPEEEKLLQIRHGFTIYGNSSIKYSSSQSKKYSNLAEPNTQFESSAAIVQVLALGFSRTRKVINSTTQIESDKQTQQNQIPQLKKDVQDTHNFDINEKEDKFGKYLKVQYKGFLDELIRTKGFNTFSDWESLPYGEFVFLFDFMHTINIIYLLYISSILFLNYINSKKTINQYLYGIYILK
ncbi:hypothetical protein EIN_470390 [Entamoeba invadens IP1]|uniref:TLDc domain-containing protein n=1 Tax=Entamoeba invadens IP1 TaxID=370355 RepID=A0A0A1TUN4_ENTIV|nr:hypothetical protein EIN_470390 [Entamoeba invadens IP1]ELP83785.1 hypothetical protein EIN_470390 [Entamoeba invadens IP1]|eukprot:XP_004183131.1 hypothetical protein EIN_470390 [Entamoeba invadens IP1]